MKKTIRFLFLILLFSIQGSCFAGQMEYFNTKNHGSILYKEDQELRVSFSGSMSISNDGWKDELNTPPKGADLRKFGYFFSNQDTYNVFIVDVYRIYLGSRRNRKEIRILNNGDQYYNFGYIGNHLGNLSEKFINYTTLQNLVSSGISEKITENDFFIGLGSGKRKVLATFKIFNNEGKCIGYGANAFGWQDESMKDGTVPNRYELYTFNGKYLKYYIFQSDTIDNHIKEVVLKNAKENFYKKALIR